MFTRFTWLLGIVLLLSIALLVACGRTYTASSDGLVVLASQGGGVLQSFSLDLGNGKVAQVNNVNGPPLPSPPAQGSPSLIVLDPAGTFAYTASAITCSSPVGAVQGVVQSYTVNSDGTLGTNGNALSLNSCAGNAPSALTIDSSGKYLFVSTAVANFAATTLPSDGIHVFSISSGTLAEVPGSPFAVPTVAAGQSPNPLALAVTPTIFPPNAVCTNDSPPATESLYVADGQNNAIFQFAVDPSSGALTAMGSSVATGTTPAGVVVDGCNRYVYVANAGTSGNGVGAYAICNGGPATLPTCSPAFNDGHLIPIVAAPYPAGTSPGPMVVSPFAGFLYVVDTTGNRLFAFQISQSDGALTPLSSATQATGVMPVAIAIRSDDSWLFVSNNGSNTGAGSLSQFAVTPASGLLTPQGTGVTTYTYPWGLAVK